MGNYKKGFAGVASQNYFAKVHDTIQSAENALSSGQETINASAQVEEQNEGYLSKAKNQTQSSGKIFNIIEKSSDQNNRNYDIGEFIPGTYITKYERAVDQLYISYSPGTVTSNDGLYSYIIQKNNQYDDEMTNKIHHVISEMQNLLNNHLQVPTATPKIEAILEEIKQSLPQSSALAQATSNEINRYYQSIARIDEGQGYALFQIEPKKE